MTENLLQKLEEKMMLLLSEVEDLRKETQRLSSENSSLRTDKDSYSKKLQDLISLLDTVNPVEPAVASNFATVTPIMVQA
jgi:regulator of replication initiation timing